MNTLVAVGAVNALFLAILVLSKKSRAMADGILSLFLFLTSLAFALVFGALEYARDGLLLFLVFSNFLFAPLFYLYVKMMVNPAHRIPLRDLLMFFPWLLANFYLLMLLDGWDEAQITWFFGVAGFSGRSMTYNLVYLLDLAAVPVFLSLSWLKLRRHQTQISAQFSDHQGIDFAWLKVLILALVVSWITIELPLMMSQVLESMSENLGLVLGFSMASLMVFYLGFHGFRQGVVYSGKKEQPFQKEEDDEPRYRRSGMSEIEASSYKENLLKIMKEQCPHLNNNLTIRDLAGLVGLTEHNISEVINLGVGVSFFDFINGYRVAEFKERVVQPENGNITLLAIALECGFSSKSSFNRIFKKSTGMTPSQFQKTPRGDLS